MYIITAHFRKKLMKLIEGKKMQKENIRLMLNNNVTLLTLSSYQLFI